MIELVLGKTCGRKIRGRINEKTKIKEVGRSIQRLDE
jgi:hypothetical protein